MARFIQFLLCVECMLIIPSLQSPRYGFEAELLHANSELPPAKIIELSDFQAFVHRKRRDVTVNPSSSSQQSKNVPSSTKKPITAPSSINGRTNVTISTTNKITTVVSISLFSLFLIFFFAYFYGISMNSFLWSQRSK